jgi:hypothetical protein
MFVEVPQIVAATAHHECIHTHPTCVGSAKEGMIHDILAIQDFQKF